MDSIIDTTNRAIVAHAQELDAGRVRVPTRGLDNKLLSRLMFIKLNECPKGLVEPLKVVDEMGPGVTDPARQKRAVAHRCGMLHRMAIGIEMIGLNLNGLIPP